jgi:hypothetical protein
VPLCDLFTTDAMSEKLHYHRPSSRPPADDPILRIMQTTGGVLSLLIGLVLCLPPATEPERLRTDDGAATGGMGLLLIAVGLFFLVQRVRAWLRRARG